MVLKDFLDKFASQFEETDANSFTELTKFKDLEEWSSLMALSIIAMTDEEYSVKIKGEDIRSSNTIEDLSNIVKSRI